MPCFTCCGACRRGAGDGCINSSSSSSHNACTEGGDDADVLHKRARPDTSSHRSELCRCSYSCRIACGVQPLVIRLENDINVTIKGAFRKIMVSPLTSLVWHCAEPLPGTLTY